MKTSRVVAVLAALSLRSVLCDPVTCALDDDACGVSALQDTAMLPRLSVSVDSPEYAASARVAAIADTRELITNGPRWLAIGETKFPFYYGPRAKPGSLALMTQVEEQRHLQAWKSTVGPLMVGRALNQSAALTTLEAIADLYDQVSHAVEKPMSADNRDEIFGLQRHTIKGFVLREATSGDLDGKPLTLSDWQLMHRCGLGTGALELTHSLFVESYATIASYNDPHRPDKYVPNVVGFFCVHAETHKLLPIEIRMLDTGVAYTPLDSKDEWTLAKMALETASVSYHQVTHVAETHALTIPLRVEMMRTMSDEHPVRALIQRHIFADFGLEMLVDLLLLNTSTALDMTYGWGATGAARFLWDQTHKGISMKDNAFYTDLRARGLDHIPGHKYVTYGTMYHQAISDFVQAYVDVYYATDDVVVHDVELQHWAKASNTIPHVRDFPTAFATKGELHELLTHLIFTSIVQHQSMNGAATWHALSIPYSSTALWAPLPTAKLEPGKTLGMRAFMMPTTVLPRALALESGFLRRVPMSESIWNAYTVAPFSTEPALAPAIRAFHAALETIDEIMVSREAGETWPYLLMRPKDVPHFIWV